MKSKILIIQSCPSKKMQLHINRIAQEFPECEIGLFSAIPESDQTATGYTHYHHFPYGLRLDRNSVPNYIFESLKQAGYSTTAFYMQDHAWEDYDNIISFALETGAENHIIFGRNGNFVVWDTSSLSSFATPYSDYKQAVTESREVMEFGPTSLFIYFNAACNASCVFCYGKHIPPYSNFRHIDLNYLENVLFPQAPHVRFINITPPGGELLLNRDIEPLLDGLIKIRPKNAMYFLHTNGSPLKREIRTRFLAGDFRYINLSLNAATETTHNKLVRGTVNFNESVGNIRLLAKERNATGSAGLPELCLSTVMMHSNIAELPTLVRLAADAGLDSVLAYFFYVHLPELANESLFFHKELYNDKMAEAKALACEYGITLKAPVLFGSGRELACNIPWNTMIINYGGHVSVCCSGTTETQLGKIEQGNFDQIWNGPGYRHLRRTINTQLPSLPACRRCGRNNPDDVRTHFKYQSDDMKRFLIEKKLLRESFSLGFGQTDAPEPQK